MNFLYNFSLEKTSVASNTIMSSTSSMFTLVLSFFLLKTPFSLFNGLGALSAWVSLVWFGFSDCDHIASLALYLSSFPIGMKVDRIEVSLETSLHFVLHFFMLLTQPYWRRKFQTRQKYLWHFSLVIVFVGFAEAQIISGFIGLCNVVTLAPVVIALHLTKIEDLSLISWPIFGSLLLNGLISMLSDLLWARAVLLTSPLVASIGEFIACCIYSLKFISFELVHTVGWSCRRCLQQQQIPVRVSAWVSFGDYWFSVGQPSVQKGTASR